MVLRDILYKLPFSEIVGRNLSIKIESASTDSRLIFPKSVFIVREGKNFNSLYFIPQLKDKVDCFLAPSKYKEAILNYQRRYKNKVFILVKDLDYSIKVLSSHLFKGIDKLKIIGITGTNGKTTISFLLNKILNEQGFSCALLGTIYYGWDKKRFNSFLTTLDNFMLKAVLTQIYKEGLDYVVLEASSHGLAQQRLKDISLLRAIFTNLSGDHLDFHKSMQAYFQAKFKIFGLLKKEGIGIINLDDKYGFIAYKKFRGARVGFSLRRASSYRPLAWRFDRGRVEFLIEVRGKRYFVKTPLLGRFNLYNVLASLSCADSLGLDIDKTIKSIYSFKGVKGRMQEVRKGVFVDYAHTPSALKQALLTLREAKFKKIILVFGCGGERDKTKRAKMGRVASLFADYSIITSDNPRSEEPLKICKQIEKGFINKNYKVILERREAIIKALKMKSSDEVGVLIAGKGHENYQVFKDRKIKFSDQKVVKDFFKR